MILGIGTDIVEIKRFARWTTFSRQRLLKIFSETELNRRQDPKQQGYQINRLASCFAAKEAFFKALSNALVRLNKTDNTFSFLASCQHIEVNSTTWQVPILEINWSFFEQKIKSKLPKMEALLSLSDEKHFAAAYVTIITQQTAKRPSVKQH